MREEIVQREDEEEDRDAVRIIKHIIFLL
jgi:hypothetical protein